MGAYWEVVGESRGAIFKGERSSGGADAERDGACVWPNVVDGSNGPKAS